MGPPGAGKGTQAERIGARERIPVLSTGEVLEEEVRRGSALGRSAAEHMDRGELVPDDVVVEIVRERLSGGGGRGFVLDGFPRTIEQVQALAAMLERRGTPLDAVLHLAVPTAALLDRLAGRAREQDRVDDDRATVARRLEVYDEETAPLIEYYRAAGLLVTVDGSGSVEDVEQAVAAALAQL